MAGAGSEVDAVDEKVAAVAAEEVEIDLREYLDILVRRKWEILLLVVLALLAAAVGTYVSPRIYEASSTVLIRSSQANSQLPFLSEGFLAGAKDPLQNYAAILRSRELARRAAAKLDLASDTAEFEAFYDSIQVQPVQGTDTIKVTVRSQDPEFARRAANALVEAFQELSQEYNRRGSRSALQFIEEQLPKVEQQLRQAEDLQLRFRQSAQVVSPSEETKVLLNKIAELETMLAEAEVSLQEAEENRRELEKQLAEQPQTLITARQIADNPMIQYYRTRLADLQTQLAGAQEQYTAKHPRVLDLQAQIEQVREQLNREVAKVIPSETESLNPVYQALLQKLLSVQADILALEARRNALTVLIQQNDALLNGLPQKELELARLTRDVEVNEQVYMMLRTKYEEMRIAENMQTSDVWVIDPAVLPTAPVSPRPVLNMAIALVLGLFAGVGVVFLLEFLDTTLKTQEDVERELQLPVLGLIPSMEEFAEPVAGRAGTIILPWRRWFKGVAGRAAGRKGQ
ncbi:MAG: hypothetical protein IMX00_10270 [Limnochordales bacterium]|nr:hypothetical protein [Limnochordales bacterium]